jgi:hypothetical protein
VFLDDLQAVAGQGELHESEGADKSDDEIRKLLRSLCGGKT